eukprot:170439-Hanusia_phi.AAC.1
MAMLMEGEEKSGGKKGGEAQRFKMLEEIGTGDTYSDVHVLVVQRQTRGCVCELNFEMEVKGIELRAAKKYQISFALTFV